MPFEWLVQLVPPLKTRAFSISSSPAAHPNEVHLTVSVVSWMTPFKRKRYGLCSKWLAELDPQQGVSLIILSHCIRLCHVSYLSKCKMLKFLFIYVNRDFNSSLVPKGSTSSSISVTSPYSHRTWYRLCSFQRICG